MVLAATPNLASSGLIRRYSTSTIEIDIMALMQCPSSLSAPTLLGYLYAYYSILRAPTTTRRLDVVLAATPNQHSSRLRRRCSTSPFAIESIALIQCPSALSAPTLVGYLYAYKSILRAPTTMRRVDVVLAATPNQHSSGLRRRCSTSTIEIESMALMLCPSALSAPTLMGYLHAYNAILQAPHTMRRVDVVLAATP